MSAVIYLQHRKHANKKSLRIGWEHEHYHGNMKYARKFIKFTKNLRFCAKKIKRRKHQIQTTPTVRQKTSPMDNFIRRRRYRIESRERGKI